VAHCWSGHPRRHRLAASGSRARVCQEKWRSAEALCGALVFVDQPAEQITAADTIEIDELGL
jgi:hypothetical protein